MTVFDFCMVQTDFSAQSYISMLMSVLNFIAQSYNFWTGLITVTLAVTCVTFIGSFLFYQDQ